MGVSELRLTGRASLCRRAPSPSPPPRGRGERRSGRRAAQGHAGRGGEGPRRVPGAQRRCRRVRSAQVPRKGTPRRAAHLPELAGAALDQRADFHARRQRAVSPSRRRLNACPPTVAVAPPGGGTKRSPITSTASVASVRPTPANTIPTLRWRACSVSSSLIRPTAVTGCAAKTTSSDNCTVTRIVNVSRAGELPGFAGRRVRYA